MFSRTKNKKISLCLAFLLCASIFTVLGAPANAADDDQDSEVFEIITNTDFLQTGTYAEYLARHSHAAPASDYSIEIDADSFSDAYPAPLVIDGFHDNHGASILTDDTGFVEYTFDVEHEGLYNILIEYYPTPGRGNDIERRLLINGDIPFNNAAFLIFPRFWTSEGEVTQDKRGNDIRRSQVETPRWNQAYCSDYLGYESHPYLLYFHSGENTLRLEGSREPMAIRRIVLDIADKPQPYATIAAQYVGLTEYQGESITVQGEDFTYSTSRMVYPLNDRTSPATEPSHPHLIRLNTVGGNQWRFPGQSVFWTINVPESALYQINIKYRQNLANGTFSTRNIRIDGETPFSEMENVRYAFNNRWDISPLSDDAGEPYLFWLEKGEHTLSMEVVLGDWAEILSIANDSVYQLNYAYRQMLLVLSSNPDPFRDYQLKRVMPEVIDLLGEQYHIINGLMDKVIEINGGRRGEGISMLENLAFHLYNMYNDPDNIPERWLVFRDNVSALSTWILRVREQPLEIDYITVSAPNASLPRAEAGFFQQLWHELRALAASFSGDFSLIGDSHEEAVDVWIVSGRDQAQILKAMIDNHFTPDTGIPVNLRLVSGAMVLPAAVTGRGPDVLLSQGVGVPVDWALRGAAASLSDMPGLDEVLQEFHPSAWESYMLDGQLYGLPETKTFLMMFARLDILEEMNLPVPRTWDEFEIVMTELQKNHMDVHIPYSFPDNINFYLSLLYQMGGGVYQDDSMKSALDSEESVQAFKHWVNFFTQHGVPVFDWDPYGRFINRFRSGEMPLGFTDYNTFNQLAVFAPELRGLWQFFPMPGTLNEQGEIDHSSVAGGTSTIMLSASDKKDKAWEFMRWWVSSDVQTLYGHELESVIGVAARYNTANRQAVENLSWTTADYRMLDAQWDWVRAFPQVPGGYFTPRHVSNAFREAVNDLTDPRETLWDYVEIINAEITNKRREFDLPYIQD